jgi:hypothetical protein
LENEKSPLLTPPPSPAPLRPDLQTLLACVVADDDKGWVFPPMLLTVGGGAQIESN